MLAWLLAAGCAADAAEYSASTMALQAALDAAGFSPGLVDGKLGPKTGAALRAFQRVNGLAVHGRADDATRAALGLATRPATVSYRVTEADLREVGGPIPEDWNARAAMDRLRYPTLSELLAERGHCARDTVRRLNPGVKLDALRPGAKVTLPNVGAARELRGVAQLEIHLDEKVIRARDERGGLLALFHCSVARLPEKRPSGVTRVATVVMEPNYTFRPEMWPEVKNVSGPLVIPPGPRNPVGLCWIGLERPGYGVHGTPNPELIGKTGSHGCLRLANWDARRLGAAVRVGTPVRFVEARDEK